MPGEAIHGHGIPLSTSQIVQHHAATQVVDVQEYLIEQL
jgi:hypothetical protein